jgi:hypothetical protein
MLNSFRLFALALVVTVGLVGCGGSSSSDFKKDYAKQRSALRDFGNELLSTVSNSSGLSNAEGKKRFNELADKLSNLRDKFDKLSPPDNVKRAYENVKSGLKSLEAHLRDAATTVGNGDHAGARAAGVAIGKDLREIRPNNQEIVSKLGLKQ